MVENGLVSIVTPSYNAGQLIGRTIDAVLQQTYSKWELIVIDDCSSDDTRDVVSAYASLDSRIRLVALEKNNGAPAAPRNIGVQQARGEWVAFLDADDIWHPMKLELQLAAMLRSQVRFSCTQMSDFSDESTLTFVDPGKVGVEVVSFSRQQVKGRIPTSSVIGCRNLFLDFPFNEDARYKAVEDYHCWLRIHETVGDSIKLAYPLLSYRKVPGQISGSKTYMLERMFMVHREYPGTGRARAILFTLTHALGAIYFRILKKGL
ncbi:glycosyltransferase family 2 protein [Microbulbifer agarilyticus]|uniref:glycosyltransferase family 2 protein n=1 Tax=Microbulbifer agarilyticus TaxID=260552 RepID=UPI001E36DA62|nr:glycosyltransferase family 2 protein [Microbulbifer agarilyticus]